MLLATCDTRYCFSFMEIGSYGSNNDSGIFKNSKMGKLFENNKMRVPEASTKMGCPFEPLPYFLLGDEIFPMKLWLMKPYPGTLTRDQRIFNYRLSRGRRTIENTFGILVVRWRIFRNAIQASVENVQRYIMACVCLHNYLRQTDNAHYIPMGFVDCEDSSGNIKPGEWRAIAENDGCNDFLPIAATRHGRTGNSSMEMREGLMEYFTSNEGMLEWQEQHVYKCGPVLQIYKNYLGRPDKRLHTSSNC